MLNVRDKDGPEVVEGNTCPKRVFFFPMSYVAYYGSTAIVKPVVSLVRPK